MRRLFATRSRETSVLHYRAQRCVHQPQTRGGKEAGNATADLISPRSTASFIATDRVVSDRRAMAFLNRASVAADCSQRNIENVGRVNANRSAELLVVASLRQRQLVDRDPDAIR